MPLPLPFRLRQQTVSGCLQPPVTEWGERHPESGSHQEGTTWLYDESDSRIRDASHLATVLDDAGDEAWLVPALALSEPTDEQEASSQQTTTPTRDQFECRSCRRATEHRFRTHESVPDETWAGQPIWECDVWYDSLWPVS